MPADGVTKDDPRAHGRFMRFFSRRTWQIVYDPSFEITRKRQARGVKDLEEFHDEI